MVEAADLADRGLVIRCGAGAKKTRLLYSRLSEPVRCAKCKAPITAPSGPIDIHSAADFDRLVASSSLPIVVDYWAPWCGPCPMVAPELQKVAAGQSGRMLVVKANTDEPSDPGQRFA